MRLTFESFEAIAAWIERERKAFAWLAKGSDLGSPFQNLRDEFRNANRELSNRLSEWREMPAELGRRNTLKAAFERVYAESSRIKVSSEAAAAIAIDVNDKLGSDAACGAYAELLGVPCNISFSTVRGIISATAIRDGINPNSARLIGDAITKANLAGLEELQRRDGQWTQLSDKARGQIEEYEQSAKALIDKTEEQATALRDRLNQDGDAAIKQIRSTEATYKEQMRLQAPVEYWEAKASVHRTAVDNSRFNLTAYAAAGTVGLLATLVGLIALANWFSSEKGGQDATVLYLKFAAVGAIVTTVAFWVGRILLRIYLSDRHLLTDAEERVAMIKTYLALTNEGKVEATERALVLGPVFRSAADGIVKDEGPDASLAGIIARAIDVKSKS